MREFDRDTYEMLLLMKHATQNSDIKMLNYYRDRFLVCGDSLLDIISNYITLDKMGYAPIFSGFRLNKGYKLYRIRRYEEGVDFSNPCQWTAPPIGKRWQNRANCEGQEALYLATNELLCILETQIKMGKKYVIATYECTEDICLGCLSFWNDTNKALNLAALVLNSFLMAPARKEKENIELFQYLDRHFGLVRPEDVAIKDGALMPFKFAVMNQNNEYYTLTNQICDVIAKQFQDGILYGSCYIPLTTTGSICTDSNVVLYDNGIKKVKYLEHSIKTCNIDPNQTELLTVQMIVEQFENSSSKRN